jgi:hypothetical protein
MFLVNWKLCFYLTIPALCPNYFYSYGPSSRLDAYWDDDDDDNDDDYDDIDV